MDQLLGMAVSLGSGVTSFATVKLKEQVGYVIHYKENLEEVKEIYGRLVSKQKDVHLQVEAGIRKGEKVLDQVEKWQDWALEMINDFDDFDEGHDLLMEKEALRAAQKCCFKLVPWSPKFRHDLSLKAKEKASLIRKRIDEIDGLSHYTLSAGPTSLGSIREGDFYEHLESRQNCVNQILTALQKDDINRIGIYGMGGAGKTTLVKELARRADYEKLFKKVVEVQISREPDIIKIQDSIAERIGLSFDGIHTPKERAYKLNERFTSIRKPKKGEQGRKLLLILDDVWSILDLHSLGVFYDLENDLGCKIVITSREKDMCKHMGASHPHIYEIGDLDTNEAELLFKGKIGSVLQQDQEEVMKKILLQCSRLPLSINILVDTLRNQDLSFWKSTLRELEKGDRGEVIGVLSKLYSILELSYDIIDSDEKKIFFLLCCLFPQGSSILVTDLLRYGIGMDLFQSMDSLCEAIKEVHKWASDLHSLSLLKEMNIHTGEIKIHDDVREVGKFIASKDDRFNFRVGPMPRWIKKETCQKYVAIAMVSDENTSHNCLCGLNLPNLQLLRLQDASDLGSSYFSGMQKIKVLDLAKSNLKTMSDSSDQLGNLRTLLLENCTLDEISWICRLVKLQVLSLKASNVKRLPTQFGQLIDLKILDLSGCDQLEDIPSGVFSKLTRLEGLYMKGSFDNWEVGGQRANLTDLTCCPSLQVLEVHIRSIDQLAHGDFPIFLHGLSTFKIYLGVKKGNVGLNVSSFQGYLEVSEVVPNDLMKYGWKAILEKTECMILLDISIRKGIDEQIHGLYLSDLQELHLFNITGIEYALPFNDRMKTLKVLEVVDCRDLKYVMCTPSIDLDEMVFSCLRELRLENLPSLLGLHDGLSSRAYKELSIQTLFAGKAKFPSLERLRLHSLREIEQLWDMASQEEHFQASFPKLKSMSIKDMSNLRYVWSNGFMVCKEGNFDMSNLEELSIHECTTMETVCPPSVAINGLQNLRNLEIRYCKALKQVISIEVDKSDECEKEICYLSSSNIITSCFPRLVSLKLVDLKDLDSFYEGRLNMEFSDLRTLELTQLKITTFIKPAARRSLVFAAHDQNDDDGDMVVNDRAWYDIDDFGFKEKTTLFISGKVTFPLLQNLKVQALYYIERVIMWDTINDQDVTAAFPNLQSIELGYMPKLEHIWDSTNRDPCSTISRSSSSSLKKLYIFCCGLKSVCSPLIAHGLKRLESLYMWDCRSLEQVISTELYSNVEDQEDNCNNNNVVSNNILQFPALSSLELRSSPSLVCFYQGSMKIEFPALERLTMTRLSKFECFAKSSGGARANENYILDYTLFFGEQVFLPSLRELGVSNLPKIQSIWDLGIHEDMTVLTKMPKPEKLVINGMPELGAIWCGSTTHTIIERLKEIDIKGCPLMKGILLWPASTSVIFKALKRLHLKNLPMIKVIFTRVESVNSYHDDTITMRNSVTSWKGVELSQGNNNMVEKTSSCTLFNGKFEFPLLEEVEVEYMTGLTKVIEDTLDTNAAATTPTLSPSLKTLVIKNCKRLKEMCEVDKGRTSMLFPRLERLKFHDLRDLRRIPFCIFPGLQSIDIIDCPLSSSKFLMDRRSAALIKRLEQLKIVGGCYSLEAIVGEEEVEYLEDQHQICFTQSDDMNMLEFPLLEEIYLEGLLLRSFSSTHCDVRLPSLKALRLSGCLKMKWISSGNLVAPMLMSAEIDNETVKLDEDLNVILPRKFEDGPYKILEDWPTTSQHDDHMDGHVLYAFDLQRDYTCNACKEQGFGWCYDCSICGLIMHPECVDDIEVETGIYAFQMQLLRRPPDERSRYMMGAGSLIWKSQHVMHTDNHPLILRRRGHESCFNCAACRKGLGWFSYICEDCYFNAHPQCVLEGHMLLPPQELDKHAGGKGTKTLDKDVCTLEQLPSSSTSATAHQALEECKEQFDATHSEKQDVEEQLDTKQKEQEEAEEPIPVDENSLLLKDAKVQDLVNSLMGAVQRVVDVRLHEINQREQELVNREAQLAQRESQIEVNLNQQISKQVQAQFKLLMESQKPDLLSHFGMHDGLSGSGSSGASGSGDASGSGGVTDDPHFG